MASCKYKIYMVCSVLSLVIFASGCTFFNGEQVVKAVHCKDVDSISVGFLVYHPNPNKYSRTLSPFVILRDYDLIVTDTERLQIYWTDLCSLLEQTKNVQTISEKEWEALLHAKAQRMKEIEKNDSAYIQSYNLTLYLHSNELIGFSKNTIEVTTIDGQYWGISFSKGPFAYATAIKHNDSAINTGLLEFCNKVIRDKNIELQHKIYNGTIRMEVHGDSLGSLPIPLINDL